MTADEFLALELRRDLQQHALLRALRAEDYIATSARKRMEARARRYAARRSFARWLKGLFR